MLPFIIIIIIIIIITCLNRMTISVIKTAINMGPVFIYIIIYLNNNYSIN